MCYKRRAVERFVKAAVAPVQRDVGDIFSAKAAPGQEKPGSIAAGSGDFSVAAHEDVSRYCPVCSQRLESRRCKLICLVCGYYMSCADYY
jgi:hypothetical protein